MKTQEKDQESNLLPGAVPLREQERHRDDGCDLADGPCGEKQAAEAGTELPAVAKHRQQDAEAGRDQRQRHHHRGLDERHDVHDADNGEAQEQGDDPAAWNRESQRAAADARPIGAPCRP